jgi:hypothetical protein
METIFWLEGIQSAAVDAANLITLYQHEMVISGDEIKTIVGTLPGWCTAGYVEQSSEISKLRKEAAILIERIKEMSAKI